MILSTLDYALIIAFFLLSLLIGLYSSRQAGSSSRSFFLSNSKMPWWLLGVSMVATTFAADTPNFVAGLIRKDGVSGNWIWWCFLLTGMLTVFFYAKLWRRTGITTDLEFYELRYSGRAASFLRGFRAIYLGVVFNVLIMANVCLAAIKIGHVMFGFSELQTLAIASVITVVYSVLGGLRGVILTDFVQFLIAMIGSILAAIYILDLPDIGGLSALLSKPEVAIKSSLLPDLTDPSIYVPLLVIPLAVQWWSVWYPGSEPGGGGYVAQRMLAAKDEKQATLAVLFFNIAHYALRPWPWIIIGLASIVIFPDLESLRQAYPNLTESFIRDDLSYPAMLTYLPAGILGLVVTSLIAAFMSTISTHLNWGSSYIVNDFYKRFVQPQASDKSQVLVGRIATVSLMIMAACMALLLEEALEAFNLLLQIGAGTGLLFILRWFWKRINPYSEIAAMAVSFLVALLFFLNGKQANPWFNLAQHEQLLVGMAITTLSWVLISLFTKPGSEQIRSSFNNLVFKGENPLKNFKNKAYCFLAGTIGIYALLFTIGNFLYGKLLLAIGLLAAVFACFLILRHNWKKID